MRIISYFGAANGARYFGPDTIAVIDPSYGITMM